MHVMIDLETMSLHHDAAILSIGAVQFSNGGIHKKFHVAISPKFWRGHLEPDTIKWWFSQSDKARETIINGDKSTEEALNLFSAWLPRQLDGIWGNGSDFDNVILENSYDMHGIKLPWDHKKNRCYRTLRSLSSIPFNRIGTHHNALDDAESQAIHAHKILKSLGLLA